MDLNSLRPTEFLILKRRALALFSLIEGSLTWCCQVRFILVFTPRYLTLLVGYSLLLHNFILKSPSIFICLNLRITISAFFKLSELSFSFKQLTRCFKSALTSLLNFVIELLRHNRLVTKFYCLIKVMLNNKCRRGHRTDPWGTPQF